MFIGNEYRKRKDELEYKVCPHCGNNKYNFTVNPSKGFWHCWACDRGGRLTHRFLLPGGEEMAGPSDEAYETPQEYLSIPDFAVPVWLSEEGLTFLDSRGVSKEEATKLGLQYAKGNLYVPYFESNQLVSFNVRLASGRWMFNGRDREYMFYVIPGKSEFVIIVEGLFDGIKLARSDHTIFVCFGRILYDRQINRLLSIFDKWILAFDNDRAGLLATKKTATKLLNKDVTLFRIQPPDYRKDFGDCTVEETTEAFKKMTKLTFSELLGLRLEHLND